MIYPRWAWTVQDLAISIAFVETRYDLLKKYGQLFTRFKEYSGLEL